MTATGTWTDLGPRMVSGAAMVVVGAAAIWAGGWWFGTLAVAAAGLMIWELAAMIRPDQPVVARFLGLAAASGVVLALVVPGVTGLALLALVALGGAALLRRHAAVFAVYGLAILLAAWGLVGFRADYGMVWLIWLVLVVVVTDIAGYFAGRTFGGPRFWPAVSPKKTWSGTIAGWIAAALVGLVFLRFTTAGPDLPWISAALSLASQMGDIAESAIKRRMGVKDSSHLIPGHGGLMDRFDGLLGAALLMLAVALIVVVPEVRP
ncbi:MAG: phosphatidate cytidylyltransferase [Rhodobacter sp.]|nr:phosphatidate cytidylyltransferase [Rhodobacter sp.]MCA3515159.1 phosphatidate cytidylyltransferase [Rhodobacter sp.]MCA3520096.1 phosphatidate cytidylyltransferase [Rhodobacter sp.]MCA3522027.1 phosphatidate cytidylyltransferase [Rhodobacter sp.]MCA3526447.1 phosphatidate cytidylyltransferase [Rhodobacter sp.]